MTREQFQALLDERARAEIDESRVVEIHSELGQMFGGVLNEREELQKQLDDTKKKLDQARDANMLMYTKLHDHSIGREKEPDPIEEEKNFQEEVNVDDLISKL